MERALTGLARSAPRCVRRWKPPVDEDIPAEEQVRILRKLFDRYYGEVAEEGTFYFRMSPTRWARCTPADCH